MAKTDEPVLQALNLTWDRIRELQTGVPPATFDLQPGRSSSCGSVEWDTAPVIVLNLIDSDRKLTGREILQILLHQATHAAARGSSTGAEGRYHPAEFRDAATTLGLATSDTRIPGIGYAPESLARGTLTRYQPQLQALDKAMAGWEPVKIRQRDRGPVGFVCSCEPPRRLRMNQGVADLGGVRCEVCGEPFVVTSSLSSRSG